MNPNTIGQGALSKAARNLLDTVHAAINAGDWKVDGACDPDASIRRLEAALAADAESERRYPIDEIVADPLGEKGSAHTDEYGYEECARRAFAAGVEWATGAKPGAAQHDLYKTGDKDVPAVILDANGDVVLGLCRRCGRGEIELEEPCVPRNPAGKAALPDLTDDARNRMNRVRQQADNGAKVSERMQRPLASVAGAKVVHDGPSEAMLQLPDGRVIRLEQLGVGHGMWGTPEDNDALCEAFASFTEHLDQGVRVTHVDHRSLAGRATRQRDAFLDQVRAAREVWIEEASENGTQRSEDVVTPFDRFLYDPPQA